jgi:predicted RNA-binding protein YlxR (DUF448 family)
MLAGVIDNETDTGPRRLAAEPERLCVVTRTVNPAADMIRFVIGPDGDVVPDVKRKLPGRGVWVTANRRMVGEAARRNVFARGFKQQVRVPADLVELTETLLERSALDALGICQKAGRVAQGFARAEAALASGEVVALIHAAEAGPDGVRKLAAAATRRFGADAGRLAVVQTFTSEQLDLALGRSNVIHAALLAGPASDRFVARCRRLERYRNSDQSVRAERRATATRQNAKTGTE